VFRSAQGTLLRIRAGNDRFYNADTYLPMFLGEKWGRSARIHSVRTCDPDQL